MGDRSIPCSPEVERTRLVARLIAVGVPDEFAKQPSLIVLMYAQELADCALSESSGGTKPPCRLPAAAWS